MPEGTRAAERPEWDISDEAREASEQLKSPRLESAISQGRVHLADLMVLERELDPDRQPDEVLRAAAVRDYPRVLAAFEAALGPITRRYAATDPEMSAVLTAQAHLDVQTNSGEIGFDWAAAREITLDAEDLRDRIGRILTVKEAYGYLEMIFNVLTHVMGAVEQTQVRTRRDGAGDQTALEDFATQMTRYAARLREVERKFLAAASRVALTRYFRGVMLGGAGLLAAVAGLGLVSLYLELPGLYAAALVAGALGAILSVMSRVARDQVTVDREAPERILMLLGAVRPFVGAIFGLAIVVLVLGEVVPAVQAPDDPGKEVYFLSGLAFLAGFSERFAQDVVVSSARTLGPGPRADEPAPQPPR